MIKSVHDYQIDDVFKKDASFFYVIPKYQREYTWSTQHWKDLYDDISENDLGYFIGSIICIDNAVDAFESTPLEVVDGQQRLTTLSILLAAIYVKLRQYKDQLNEDDEDELPTLRKSLRCLNAPHELILSPQIQGSNLADYLAVMAEAGIIKAAKKENYWGNRKIARCYKYFVSRLEQDIENSDSPIETLLQIKKKVSKAVLVKIEVGNHAGQGELENGSYEVWGVLDTAGDQLYFELYDNPEFAEDSTPYLSYWAELDGDSIVPVIGDKDAWLFDIYLTEDDKDALTFTLNDGVLSAEYFYYDAAGPEACDISIVLTPDL